jgi:hypothetical protein
MFGILIAGRLVQTDMQQVGETQFLFNIQDADNINHIVVFMTGQTPFPDGFGGAVYFCWPSTSGPSWQLLGHISNNKPSAIFKVANLKKDGVENANPFGALANQQNHMAQIGISVESIDQLVQQTPVTNTTASNLSSFKEFTQKMLESCFNYLSSFAVSQAQMTPNPSEAYVPLSALQQWFQTFQRRLEQNPNFWRT